MTVFTIVVMGVIVFAMRFSFFALPQDKLMTPTVQRTLSFVLPAVLMAIVFPSVLLDAQGALRPIANPYLIGAGVGIGVGVFKRDSFFLVFGASVVAFALAKVVLA